MSHTQTIIAILATCLAASEAAATLEETLLAEGPAALASEARRSGDAKRGAAIFYGRTLACVACHAAAGNGKGIGPDLTAIDKAAGDTFVVESILEPSKAIAPAYASTTLELADGRVITGVVAEESSERLVVRDAAQPEKLINVASVDVEERHAGTQSLMPAGQVNQLADRGQFLDLVRYVLEVRDGGAKRARELAPPSDAATVAAQFPDVPRPWQPFVQRGDLTVGPVPGGRTLRIASAIAAGFAAGTVAFDAAALETVAAWDGGFVRPAAQPYFGVFWHRAGAPADLIAFPQRPLAFRVGSATWRCFEPAATSDPNTGSRFMGIAVGRSTVRLSYRGRIDTALVGIDEDVQVEERAGWVGVIRRFSFSGLPAAADVAVAVADEMPVALFASDGKAAGVADGNSGGNLTAAAATGFMGPSGYRIVCGGPFMIQPAEGEATTPRTVVTAKAADDGSATVHLAQWARREAKAAPDPAAFAALMSRSAAFDEAFTAPVGPRSLPPEPKPLAVARPTDPAATRPAIDSRLNVDEFPSVAAKFVRFSIQRTADSAPVCLDEIELFSADSNTNLAAGAKVTASSALSGMAIHRVAHLVDGKYGNANSWVAGNAGPAWVQIDLPEPREIGRVVWGRDRSGGFRDRLASIYRIEVSNDGEAWKQVSSEAERKSGGIAGNALVRDVAPGYDAEPLPPPFPGCRVSDVAFTPDGVLYCLAMTEGQVWRTRLPPPDRPQQVAWQRYASGLYHPIGLAVIDSRLFVAQKPEVTELLDHDGDGTVDRQRTVATGWGLSTGWHEYCFGLAVDSRKDLWFALNTGYFWTSPGYVNPGRFRGSIFKVEHGSERFVEVATGCRVPNGIAAGPGDEIFFTDNQGDWIQSCKLAHVVPGRFYGHPETTDRKLAKDIYPDGRVAVWLPHDKSRSSSGPVCDASGGSFGPFAGQWFVGDVGYGANTGILRAAVEKVDGEYQGAVMPFITGQPRGCERMKFGPDGRLYLATLTDGLVRVAFRGEMPLAVRDVVIRPGGAGFTVRLTKPIAESCAVDAAQWKVRRWHYLYTGQYGSPQAELKSVPVKKVDVSSDRTEIALTLPVETHPIGMVYEIAINDLADADGAATGPAIAWYTVHRIPK